MDVKRSQHYTHKHNNEDHSAMYHHNSNPSNEKLCYSVPFHTGTLFNFRSYMLYLYPNTDSSSSCNTSYTRKTSTQIDTHNPDYSSQRNILFKSNLFAK